MWGRSQLIVLVRVVSLHVSRGVARISDWQVTTCFYGRSPALEEIRKPDFPHVRRMQSLSQPYPNDNITNKRSCLFNISTQTQKMQTVQSTNHFLTKGLSKTYEETIATLNSLQSNATTILRSQKDPTQITQNMILIEAFLEMLDISQEDLKTLNVIHVAGTKGKGSTCAFTESILRSSRYKTGFFCSPHLVAVRERICINGKPLSASQFVFHFWDVYNKIYDNTMNKDKVMPMYFMFLTLMAFHVFLHEKVDVAVMEVGIGGEYDCTNIIRFPKVVGLTSIGLDHVTLLGDTLEKIGWQKAGIMKEDVPAFTVQQPPGVLAVFSQRAHEKKCPLYVVPNLKDYDWTHSKLHISAQIQEVNISLAFQLVNAWIGRHSGLKETYSVIENSLKFAETFEISSVFETGLQKCVWLGRFQKLQKDKIMYFLDGAHTLESIECCADWFKKSSEILRHGTRKNILRVLLFNCTRDRKPEILLFPLSQIHFDVAIFSTNNVKSHLVSSSDLTNYNADREKEIQQCQNNMNVWQHFMSCAAEEEECATRSHVLLRYLVSEAVRCLEVPQYSQLSSAVQQQIANADQIHVLVTGSLHLVGSVLSIIDPEMNCMDGV